MISLIVAASQNGVIGKEGKIPWFVRGEQARFKDITMGHPIIMGRKTHESIGRTLPGRLNVVISGNPNYKVYDGSILVHSFEEALALDEVKSANEVFVIGGEQVFKDAMPLATKIYLTKVHANIDGDKYFKYDPGDWEQVSSELHKKQAADDRPYDFEICVLKRIHQAL